MDIVSFIFYFIFGILLGLVGVLGGFCICELFDYIRYIRRGR